MTYQDADAQASLQLLLAALEEAVRRADRERATELEALILRRVAARAAEHLEVEQRVRILMARFEERGRPQFQDLPLGVGTETIDGVVYPVWYGTNRRRLDTGNGFSAERSEVVTRGLVDVFVPRAHRFGETGSGFWKRLRRLDLRDDHLRVQAITTLGRDAFMSEIEAAMRNARDRGDAPHALLFLHGYNNTFDEAAIRAAQLGCDLRITGVTAFFAWPSRGSVRAYPADESSIEASERAITDFILDLTSCCGSNTVHIVAHSMGNRGLLRSLQRIAADAKSRGQVTLGQVILAAPDVDRDLFMDLADLYRQHAERTTLYASRADLAVHASAILHGAPRAGYFEPYSVAPGVDTVAVPDFDVDLLGHGYFAQVEALIYDMSALIEHNQAPSKRKRLSEFRSDGSTLWRLGR